eukprot:11186866-Lingulodinium_polyedra.AAC.1
MRRGLTPLGRHDHLRCVPAEGSRETTAARENAESLGRPFFPCPGGGVPWRFRVNAEGLITL